MMTKDTVEAGLFTLLVASVLLRCLWGHTPIRLLVMTLIFVESVIQQAIQSIGAGAAHYRENFTATLSRERRTIHDPDIKIVRRA